MILQEVLVDGSGRADLYFRIKGVSVKKGNAITLIKNTVFSTDTYYGSLSIGKWKKYCGIDKIRLHITMQGEAEVVIVQSFLDEKRQLSDREILTRKISAAEAKKVEVELPDISEGTVFFSIRSISDQTIFQRAEYEAECCRKREVNLALNVCTFCREKFLLRNIWILKNAFLENDKSPLYGHLKVFITDNGRTLNMEKLASPDISVFYNPNVGGAGGFSRGLLEISRKKDADHITNVIFMDDDIEIIPETLLRTYRMLCILKEEYKDAFLAGAMLRQDYKYIQYENAARWNSGNCEFINRGLDLRSYRNVVYNETEKQSEYGAWWYCCVPSDIVTPDNLAMPLFIHMDDIEYSLRNADLIITLNGVAVIHPVGGQKVVSSNAYYDLRNMMIVNAKYAPDFGKRELKKIIWKRMSDAYLRYRYKDVRLLYKAVEDFHKGPDWLMQLDAAAYHMKILEEGYQFTDVSDMADRGISAYVQREDPVVDPFGRKKGRWTVKKAVKFIIMAVTLNGAYLPSKPLKAFDMNVTPAKLFRHSEIVLFDENSMQGITLRRDVMKIVELICLYRKTCRMLDKQYEVCRKLFETAWHDLHSRKYWDKVIRQE